MGGWRGVRRRIRRGEERGKIDGGRFGGLCNIHVKVNLIAFCLCIEIVDSFLKLVYERSMPENTTIFLLRSP
jgi:hypothetical protein